MPDVNGPFLIDTEHYGDWTESWYTQTGTPGVFEFAGDLFMVIWSTANHPSASGGLRNVGVAKSTDGGVTWARFGLYLTPPNNPNEVWVTPNPPAGKLKMLVGSVTAGSTRRLAEFDLATGVWTIITSTVQPTQRLNNYAYDAVGGVDWLLYKDGTGVLDKLWAIPYSGGVWGTPVEIAGGGSQYGATCKQVRADPINGRLHIVYYYSTTILATQQEFYYVQIKPDGSLTTPVLVGASHFPEQVGDVHNNTINQIGFTSTEIVIPWERFVGPGLNEVVGAIWVLTPFTADAPTLTQFWDEIQTAATVLDVSVSQTMPDGSVTVWWAPNTNISTGAYESSLKYKTFKAGVFGTEVTFHDEIAFPITPPSGTTYLDSSIFGITQPVLLVSGFWSTSTVLELQWTATGFQPLYTQVFWVGLAPSATITINKVTSPVSDTGLFNLQLDGVTQAADQGNGGTTGPVVVAPGTHQAGESAGTGTSLADYTTAYGGDAAPDGSVSVAAGQNKIVTITNTRNPLSITCDNPPSGQVGIVYSHAFPALGGTPPYTFSILAGSLPPGLTLDPATGIVSGTPTAAGTYPFIIQVASS